MKRIGFAFNPTSDDAIELREHGLAWCRDHGLEAWASSSDQAPEAWDSMTRRAWADRPAPALIERALFRLTLDR